MIANHRQLSLLYELMTHPEFLRPEELSRRFQVSTKTIRSDIGMINDTLRPLAMRIEFRKGRGYRYLSQNSEKTAELIAQFQYRFYDIYDLRENFKERVNLLLRRLMETESCIKLEVLAQQAGLTPASISKELKEVRKILKAYHLELRSRPYYGLMIAGREIEFRYCLMDSITYFYYKVKWFDLFGEQELPPDMDRTNRMRILNTLIKYLKKYDYVISDAACQKMTIMIIITARRVRTHHSLTFTDEEAASLKTPKEYEMIVDLCQALESIQVFESGTLNQHEILFLTLFFLCNIDLYENNCKFWDYGSFYETTQKCVNDVSRRLYEHHLDFMKIPDFNQRLTKVLLPITIAMQFHIREKHTISRITSIVKLTPLCSAVVSLINQVYFERFQEDLTEESYCVLILFIYNSLMQTGVENRRLKLLINPILNRFVGESLRQELRSRWGSFIEKIDILKPFQDMEDETMKQYDCLISFDSTVPLGLEGKIRVLRVNYFLDDQDSQRIYHELIQPLTQISSPFALKSEVCREPGGLNAESLMSFLEQKTGGQLSAELRESQCSWAWTCRSGVMSVILFSEAAQNHLIHFEKPCLIDDRRVEFCFLWVLDCQYSLTKIKTAEEATRRLIQNPELIARLFAENPPDFTEVITQDPGWKAERGTTE